MEYSVHVAVYGNRLSGVLCSCCSVEEQIEWSILFMLQCNGTG